MSNGAVSIQRTVLGDAPGGVAVRLAASVLINDVILQPRSAVGTAPAQQIAAASVDRSAYSSTGVATSGTVADGIVELERRTAFGAGPDVPIIVLERRSAVGVALNGSFALGTAVQRVRSADGVGISQGMAVGTVRLQTRIAAAVAFNGGGATGTIELARRQSQGTNLSGSVGLGSASLRRRTATGDSATAALAVGAVTRPHVFLTGEGEAVIAETYRTWVINVQNEALSEYTNHSFNSYANFNDKTFAAGPSGLFELSGETDNSTAIPWVLRTGFHDDKDVHQKRLHELVMSLRHDAPVRVRVWTDESTFYDYTLVNYRTTLQQVRIKTGKGLKSRYYRIELAGAGGTNFEIDSLLAPYVPVGRRVG